MSAKAWRWLFIALVVLFLLDELALYWWKDFNPGWIYGTGRNPPPPEPVFYRRPIGRL